MYQLSYRSIAVPGLNLDDLDTILQTAIHFNSQHHITGCLIYHNDNFVQIIEGKKDDVLNLYKGIMKDDRHHSINLLWENEINERFFDDWNMAFYRPTDTSVQQFVNNFLMLSDLSDRPTSSLLSFWSTVRKILLGGPKNQFEAAY